MSQKDESSVEDVVGGADGDVVISVSLLRVSKQFVNCSFDTPSADK